MADLSLREARKREAEAALLARSPQVHTTARRQTDETLVRATIALMADRARGHLPHVARWLDECAAEASAVLDALEGEGKPVRGTVRARHLDVARPYVEVETDGGDWHAIHVDPQDAPQVGTRAEIISHSCALWLSGTGDAIEQGEGNPGDQGT